MGRFILVTLLLAIAPHTASQSQEVGSGPLTISPKVEAGYEQFMRESDRYFFAVSRDGEDFGYSFCRQFGSCRKWGGRKVAIESCEEASDGVPCYIYANMNGVLWKGEVTVWQDECTAAYKAEDWDAAHRTCRVLAEQGYIPAQATLGALHLLGRGAPEDLVQAHMWFSLAVAQLPDSESRDMFVDLRDTISEALRPAQVAESERLVREWREKNKKGE